MDVSDRRGRVRDRVAARVQVVAGYAVRTLLFGDSPTLLRSLSFLLIVASVIGQTLSR